MSHADPTRRDFLAGAATLAATAAVTSSFGAVMQPNAAVPAKMTVRADAGEHVISKHLHGHFAEHLGRCVYDGIWVGPDSKIPNQNGYRTDVVEALKALEIPNLRWPGGCFADDYHWRDGVGPRADRPKTVNIHWGNYPEDNSFGTHEFLDLCELLGCDAYLAANVGSSTPADMRRWLEYCTYDGDSTLANERRANGRAEPWRIPFLGIGNENWGCGGDMTAEHYTDLYNNWQVYAREFGGNRMTRVAGGPNVEDYRWAEVLLTKGRGVRAISWHNYTIYPDWNDKGSAVEAGEDRWAGYLAKALHMGTILRKADELFDKHDPRRRVGIYFDEWGTWHKTEDGDTALYQQNTIRDALVASVHLDLFAKHCARVKMTNIAQTVNVLQSVILTERGGQDRMLLTPTYHVFEMYKPFKEATLLPSEVTDAGEFGAGRSKVPTAHGSAARAKDGRLVVAATNLHPTAPAALTVELRGATAKSIGRARVLKGDGALDAHNTFDKPDAVRPADLQGAKLDGTTLTTTLPPASVAVFELA